MGKAGITNARNVDLYIEKRNGLRNARHGAQRIKGVIST